MDYVNTTVIAVDKALRSALTAIGVPSADAIAIKYSAGSIVASITADPKTVNLIANSNEILERTVVEKVRTTQQAIALFALADTDSDGALSLDEIDTLCSAAVYVWYGISVGSCDAEKLFAELGSAGRNDTHSFALAFENGLVKEINANTLEALTLVVTSMLTTTTAGAGIGFNKHSNNSTEAGTSPAGQ